MQSQETWSMGINFIRKLCKLTGLNLRNKIFDTEDLDFNTTSFCIIFTVLWIKSHLQPHKFINFG